MMFMNDSCEPFMTANMTATDISISKTVPKLEKAPETGKRGKARGIMMRGYA